MLGHTSGGNPARQLASKPEVVKRLSLYRDKIKALATLGLGFEHDADLLARTERDDDAIAHLQGQALGHRVIEELGQRHGERHPRA